MAGSAQFVQAFAPLVEAGAMPLDIAVDIFTGMARVPKLGKQVEDALSRWGQHAQEDAKNPKPQPPDPAMLKIQADQQQAQAELQSKNQQAQADIQLRNTQAQSDAQLRAQELQSTAALKDKELQTNAATEQAKLAHARDIETLKAQTQAQLERERMQHEKDIEAHKTAANVQLERERMAVDRDNKHRELQSNIEMALHKINFEKEKHAHQAQMDGHKLELEKDKHVQGVELERDKTFAEGKGKKASEFSKRLELHDKKQAEAAAAIQQAVQHLVKVHNAPKTIVHDKHGKAVGVQTIIDGKPEVRPIKRDNAGRAIGLDPGH